MIGGWLIPAWLKRAVAGLVAGATLLWGAWAMGKRDGAQAAKARAAEKAADDYRATTEGMNNADIGVGDVDDDTEWLSKRKDKR